ncbi:protein phosphatase 2C domain-containing protein [Streptomyces sp. NBC_01167]|uniref:protein phosphatase 2C domain-containing protein n=1 Tax=Streptomyces sp. NBC_01167 TaxID=2903756 RepID=UPI00386A64F7|nr:protein phosphatase 2C domain-containing protein [Streptomyces sp. NBC_01167]
MSQQGERPTTENDWWNRLYDESAPDTGPATKPGDTLDDRFDSAADAVSAPEPAADQPDRPKAWWETDPADTLEVPGLPEGLAAPAPSAGGPSGDETSDSPDWPFTAPDRQAPRPPAPRHADEPRAPARSVPDRTGPDRPAAAPGSGLPDRPGRPPAFTDDRSAGTGFDPYRPGSASSARPPRPSDDGGPSAPGTPPVPPSPPRRRAPWEPPVVPAQPQSSPPEPRHAPAAGEEAEPPQPRYVPAPVAAEVPEPPAQPPVAPPVASPRPRVDHVGDGPPTYDAEPTALPAAGPDELDDLVADTVLDGARYGTYTLRAASVRGDSARFRGEPRRDALLTARFGSGPAALLLVAVASGARAADGAHLAAADACRWIGGAVGRSHARLSEDIRAGRRGDLKSGLHRLTDRSLGKLRAGAAARGVEPEDYSAGLRCLLLSADPDCRTRVFFGVGPGGLFRLRDGVWQDIEPPVPEPAAVTGAPVVGFGSAPAGDGRDGIQGNPLAGIPSETPAGDRLTMDLGIPTPPAPYVEAPPPPPPEPFRFRASVARPGDALLLCSPGLAEPLRGEPALADELAGRWASVEPPGLATFLADTQVRVKGYADDRTAVAVWEA